MPKLSKNSWVKIITFVIFVTIFFILVIQTRDFNYQVMSQKENILSFVNQNYILSVVIFMLLYFIFVIFSLPAAGVMTILAGFLFGLWGVLYVNISATLGATLAFGLSRYLIGHWVQTKFENKLNKFNQEIQTYGSNYLLTLRLIPIFPFFLINLLSGLTKVSTWTFFWTTLIGTLPGTFLYVYFGTQLGQVESAIDLLNWQFILALVLLVFVPIAMRFFIKPKSIKNESNT